MNNAKNFNTLTFDIKVVNAQNVAEQRREEWGDSYVRTSICTFYYFYYYYFSQCVVFSSNSFLNSDITFHV